MNNVLGFNVDQNTLNMKAANAVIALRNAFEQAETIFAWLANHPNAGPDPLTQEPFNYSEDEAYALRTFFETMHAVNTENVDTFAVGRKMTGLE